MTCGLSEKHLQMIVDVLHRSQVSKAVVFGSRALGNWRVGSDVDIAVWGQVNIAALVDALDEMPTPYTFDVLAHDEIRSDALRLHIERDGVVIASLSR